MERSSKRGNIIIFYSQLMPYLIYSFLWWSLFFSILNVHTFCYLGCHGCLQQVYFCGDQSSTKLASKCPCKQNSNLTNGKIYQQFEFINYLGEKDSFIWRNGCWCLWLTSNPIKRLVLHIFCLELIFTSWQSMPWLNLGSV